MPEHMCTVCFQPKTAHPERCSVGCRHFQALCCEGCECGSFEKAYHDETESDELRALALGEVTEAVALGRLDNA